MTIPLWSLFAFALWTLMPMLACVGGFRVGSVLLGKAAPNAWPTHKEHEGPEFYKRAMRAHVNCVENLPVFAALVVIAHLAGLSSPTFDLACQITVAARIGQTVAHIASGRSMGVNIRFAFFCVQLGCYAVLAASILTA